MATANATVMAGDRDPEAEEEPEAVAERGVVGAVALGGGHGRSSSKSTSRSAGDRGAVRSLGSRSSRRGWTRRNSTTRTASAIGKLKVDGDARDGVRLDHARRAAGGIVEGPDYEVDWAGARPDRADRSTAAVDDGGAPGRCARPAGTRRAAFGRSVSGGSRSADGGQRRGRRRLRAIDLGRDGRGRRPAGVVGGRGRARVVGRVGRRGRGIGRRRRVRGGRRRRRRASAVGVGVGAGVGLGRWRGHRRGFGVGSAWASGSGLAWARASGRGSRSARASGSGLAWAPASGSGVAVGAGVGLGVGVGTGVGSGVAVGAGVGLGVGVGTGVGSGVAVGAGGGIRGRRSASGVGEGSPAARASDTDLAGTRSR